MKTFRQHGFDIVDETTDTGNVCNCCRDYTHAAHEFLRDDVECESCHTLCCCSCHRSFKRREVPVEET